MINYDEFQWHSDFNGEEVGYDDIDIVGVYSIKGYPIYVYIDILENKILDAWLQIEE